LSHGLRRPAPGPAEARARLTAAQAKVIANPAFGQAKVARNSRRFSLRKLRKIRRERTLVRLCSNLLKLVKAPLSLQAEPA